MIQGFRKLVDIPIEDLDRLETLERALAARAIRHQHQILTSAGRNRDEKVWRVFVYCRDLCCAQTILGALAFHAQKKVIAIS